MLPGFIVQFGINGSPEVQAKYVCGVDLFWKTQMSHEVQQIAQHYLLLLKVALPKSPRRSRES